MGDSGIGDSVYLRIVVAVFCDKISDMTRQEKNFLTIGVISLVVAAAVVYLPSLFSSQSKKTQPANNEAVAEEVVVSPAPNSKVGVIAEGENAGMEVDMSDALLIQDTWEGEGAEVKAGDKIRIHYTGTLEDGTVFDSSVQRGTPFETTIGVGELIQGWDDGIPGMKVGGRRRLTIPPSKAYGDRELPNIPAGSTLIFDVELLEIL